MRFLGRRRWCRKVISGNFFVFIVSFIILYKKEGGEWGREKREGWWEKEGVKKADIKYYFLLELVLALL